MVRITATDAARNFSDLLNRVKYRRERFEVVRNDEVVARIEAPPDAASATVGELLALVRAHAVDDAFADDLERIQAEQQLVPGEPWPT